MLFSCTASFLAMQCVYLSDYPNDVKGMRASLYRENQSGAQTYVSYCEHVFRPDIRSRRCCCGARVVKPNGSQ